MNEESIVSDIPGTTREAEDELNIEGYKFRFIDTAGIRNTTDTIENLGIKNLMTNYNQKLFFFYAKILKIR